MDGIWGLFLLTGVYPLARALRANRDTTLRQPLLWSLLAWAAWMTVAWSPILRIEPDVRLEIYLALCLSGCAGVAVFGARRPGGGAWNFVVVGLLAVLLLPVLNGLGQPRLETVHWLFLSVTLAVPTVNYLPTRLGPSAVLLAMGCGLEMARLIGAASSEEARFAGMALVSVSPWTAWATLRSRRSSVTEFDRVWLSYRDGFGFLWGQRMREQFNRAAHHAGWPVHLRWGGLDIPIGAMPDSAELLAVLRAVLKRFGPVDHSDNLSKG
jgi:hypothetical protein